MVNDAGASVELAQARQAGGAVQGGSRRGLVPVRLLGVGCDRRKGAKFKPAIITYV